MKNILRNANFGFTKWCIALIAAGWMASTGWGQILTFDFAGKTGSEASVSSNLNNAGLTASTISRGSGITASGNADRFNAVDWAITSIANAISGSDYMEFTITPNSGKQFSVSSVVVQWQRSATGNTQIALRSSVDNYASDLDTVKSVTDNTTTQTFTWTFTQANKSTPITYRFYSYGEATGGSGGPGDGTGNDIVVNGSVSDSATPGTPTITLNPATPNLSAFTTTAGTASTAQTFAVTGSNLTENVVVNAPSGFEVSQDSTGFASSQTLVQSGGTLASKTISVRISASTAAGSLASANVALTSAGATTANVAVSGTVNAAGAASISVTGGTLTAFSTVSGQASEAQSFSASGSNLTSDITVTAPTGFEVSTDAASYASSKTLAQASGTVAPTTISVRIAASTAPGTLASANVTVGAAGVTTANVAVSGSVTTPALTLTLNPTSVAENAGATASTGTVGIPFSLANDLTVTLVSANTAAATVPASLTITSGQTSATFAIAAVANTNSYVDTTSAITASATNYTSANATLTVTNVDAPPVTTISLASLAVDSYTQSFDSLGTASIPGAISSTAGVQASLAVVTGSATLNGWYATKTSGTGTTSTAITPDAGGGSSGYVYSYGAASAPDRALGVLASNSNIMAIGALIKNDTGATINSIKLSFTAEFWRSSTSVQNVLSCAIGKVDGSTITTANFLTAPSAIALVRGNITGPAAVSSNAALDGNNVANQVAVTDVVIPLQLAPGETGFVRWSDVNDNGNDAGLAIDNLRMTASLNLPAADGDGVVSLANSTVSSPYTLSGIWAAGGTSQAVSVNVTPLLDSTTLTSASILVPTEFGVPLVGNVTSTGGASGGTPTVVGQLITLNGVSITKANPGVINIAGLSTPTTGTIAAGNGVYPFTVSTAGDGGTLKAVFASPAANVLIPIANIRDIDANGAPVDKNTIVAVEGICTAAPLGGTSFIQDASYGIAIYPATTTPAFALGMVAGRKYAVVGTLVDYNGMAEIKPASVSGVVDLGVASIPTPITITVVEAKAEQYESMLVTIAGLTRDAAETDAWAASKTITVKNSAGNAIDVRIQSESTATTEPAYPVTITGILQQNSSATPRALTYQIMPRTPADLSFAPGLKLAWSTPAVILENGAGFDPSITFLTVSRVGSSAGTASVQLSVSPAGRMLNNGSALPQTINFAAGEISKVLALTPVDDSVYTGDTVVTITATDKAGVLTLATATAQILEDETSAPSDTTAPVITLRGSATITLDWGSVYIDAGATATDNVDSSVTVNSSGTVNTAKPGVYTISYTASDVAGNAAIRVVRTVTVLAPTSTPGADGVSGLLRYAFGANGPNDSVTKPTTVLTGGNLVLTAIVRVDDAKLAVVGEAVTDLVNYASGDAVTTVNGSSAGVNQTGVPAGCERQAFTVAQGSDLKKFLRLKVILAP